ncbi:MAG: DUF1989 domain-containing protein [Candidatus Binatia bacterium]
MRKIAIAPADGAAFVVRRDETIQVAQKDGHQIGDFICYNAHNYRERLSTGETFNFNTVAGPSSMFLKVGSRFWSNAQNPMFEIIEDQANGVHDFFYAPCSSQLYKYVMGDPMHSNCRDNLTKAVKPYGLDYLDIPDPVNLFQHTRPRPDGSVDYDLPGGKAGEYIALRALMDCLVAISTCPFDVRVDGKEANRCNGLEVRFV